MPAICPKCLSDMNEIVHEGVTIDVCPGCRGIWLDPGELAMLRGAETDLPRGPENVTTGPRYWETTTYICPRCEGGFESFEYAPQTGLIIDRCKDCNGIYLDAGELKKIRSITASQKRVGLSSPPAAGGQLRDLVQAEGARPKTIAAGDSSSGVYFFQLLTGLPVEVDAPRQRFPWVVLGLILVNALVFLYQAFGLGNDFDFYMTWAFVPGTLQYGQGWVGLVSGQFLHGGWLHLLGNLYFLWLFGDNVEDRMSRGLFVFFYLLCGMAAFGIHAILTNQPGVPTLGASGAISGVMGAYLVLYPRRQMYQVLWFIQFKVSVVFYLLVWLGMQILFSSMGAAGVAWYAHIGGFAVGAGGIWALRNWGLVRPDPFAQDQPTA